MGGSRGLHLTIHSHIPGSLVGRYKRDRRTKNIQSWIALHFIQKVHTGRKLDRLLEL